MQQKAAKIEKVVRVTKGDGKIAWYDNCELSCLEFHDGFMPVSKNGRWGFIDVFGNEICALKYEEVDNFNEGFAPVCRDSRWTFIDTEGREICLPKYDDVDWFVNGYAEVELNGKCGFINSRGEEIGSICYDDAWNFQNGWVKVRLGDRWGHMNEAGAVEWEESRNSEDNSFFALWQAYEV